MSDLETQLRALAARGELTYVSVVPVAGKNGAGVTFVAQVTPASRFGHAEGRDVDPVNALMKAIDELPKFVKKPTRVAAQEPEPEPEPWDN